MLFFCWDIFYQKRLGAILWYGGVQIAWMARFLDKTCQNINVQLCVNSGPFANYLFFVWFHSSTQHTIYMLANACLIELIHHPAESVLIHLKELIITS